MFEHCICPRCVHSCQPPGGQGLQEGTESVEGGGQGDFDNVQIGADFFGIASLKYWIVVANGPTSVSDKHHVGVSNEIISNDLELPLMTAINLMTSNDL